AFLRLAQKMNEGVFESRRDLFPDQGTFRPKRRDRLFEGCAVLSRNVNRASEYGGGLNFGRPTKPPRSLIDPFASPLKCDEARSPDDFFGRSLGDDSPVRKIDDAF